MKIDTIPTKLLKNVLKDCMCTLTKIINLSLKKGKFHDGWKSAVARPLIKSLPKGTIKTNYRPVHNLSFISKIVKKCTLEQFTQHYNYYDHSLKTQCLRVKPGWMQYHLKLHESKTEFIYFGSRQQLRKCQHNN